MTARLIRSHELIEVARALVPPKVGPGGPTAAQLRRAVSTAYYALFHELVAQATAELCGPGPDSEAARRHAARWMTHTDLLALTKATIHTATGSAGRAVATVLGSPHSDLEALATAFVSLQEARHGADYDHDFDLTHEDAVEPVDEAARAIEAARRLGQGGDPSYRRFLKLMVGAVKIARARTGVA